MNQKQNSHAWVKARSLRITASRCYELYTYTKNKNPNWEKKVAAYCREDFTGNEATDYGLKAEGEAVDIFENTTDLKVHKVGLIIHPQAPWLGYSPDGFVMINNKLISIEIKCPIMGISTTATEVVKTLQYICIDEYGAYALKKKHKYYGQVQCGMHVCGIKECYFIVYATYDKTFVLINVERDEKFIRSQFEALHDVYFKHFLPYFFKNAN